MDDDRRTAQDAQNSFALGLRQVRLRYGLATGQGELTQKEFARVLGISGDRPEERYRLYENAKREPPLWILAAIRRVTGYSLDDLIAQLPAGRRLERTPSAQDRQADNAPIVARARPKGPSKPRPLPGAKVAGARAPRKKTL